MKAPGGRGLESSSLKVIKSKEGSLATRERFEDIKAWQAARDLVLAVYRVSGRGKFEKDFGLRDQIRRASVSAMSNIAEGFERCSDREFHRFLYIAKVRKEKCAVICSWRWIWST